MARHKDLIGMKFGKLKVLKLDHKQKTERSTKVYWLCECECGNEKVVRSDGLTTGHSKSCGCLVGKHNSSRNRESRNNFKHGDSGTRLYRIWCGMKNRCSDASNPAYYRYGGIGINICGEWEYDYSTFKEWAINNEYKDSLTIDRIDNKKGYSPDNCRWADSFQQNNNKSNNIMIEIDGETKTIGEWAVFAGLKINAIRNRYRRGDIGKRLIRPIAKGGI